MSKFSVREIDGKPHVDVSSLTDWTESDWRDLCNAIGAEITPQRLATIQETAVKFIAGRKCDFVRYSLNADGTVKQNARDFYREFEMGDDEA